MLETLQRKPVSHQGREAPHRLQLTRLSSLGGRRCPQAREGSGAESGGLDGGGAWRIHSAQAWWGWGQGDLRGAEAGREPSGLLTRRRLCSPPRPADAGTHVTLTRLAEVPVQKPLLKPFQRVSASSEAYSHTVGTGLGVCDSGFHTEPQLRLQASATCLASKVSGL